MKHNKGFTLLELLLSIFATSLLISAIGGLYVSYMKSNMKMKELLTLRRQFAYANQLLEKDIHMAGFNLPGNGIQIDIATIDHTMFLLKNEQGLQTRLFQSAGTGDTYIFAADAINVFSNVVSNDWVCLYNSTSGTIEYLEIINDPEPQTDGSWRVSFGLEALDNSWDFNNTDVYFAKAVRYSVDGTEPEVAFVRSTPQNDFKISKDITKLVITPRDSIGMDLTGFFPGADDRIRRVGIELIKPIPDNTDNPISSSVEVSIRNFL